MTNPARAPQPDCLLEEEARVDVAHFRAAMGAFPTGVTVVTTRVGRELYGLTVNSFASVSLDPMLVLVCLNNSSRAVNLILESGSLAINVLSAGQMSISRRFADRDRPTGEHAFAGVPHVLEEGKSPIIADCAVAIQGRVHETHVGGDHVIVIARVDAVIVRPDLEPLVFHGGGYRPLGKTTPHRPALRVVT
ncbi:MAG: flavin reductase FMN-binding protein [Pseudonocardiales bacterium]|nr:flavin reductase FMN-binding protein [Pseudonocardiales bacterium]